MANEYLNNLIKQNLIGNTGSGLENTIFKDYYLYKSSPVSTNATGTIPSASIVPKINLTTTETPSSWWGDLGSSMSEWWGDLGSSISDSISNASLPELMDAAKITTSAYSNFFGDNKDIFKARKQLLNQQIANNEYNMAHKKEFDTLLQQGSNEALKNLKPQSATRVV